jgi:hypothetical protein
MGADKPLAEQQTADGATRKARNPNASKQTIADSQAKPEFQINRERLKAERLAREAEDSKKTQ